ncbi:MAG: GNAT family N-acetyltransferase, partial [Actinomycetota bacterium]
MDLSPPRSESDARLLQRIYPLYLHELSALTDYYRVDDEGRWQPDHLPDWLRGGQQHALIIRVGARPAGFSFVAEVPFPYMHPDCDFQLSEFFVLNQWRRRGVGTAAALGTFGRFGGRWVVTEVTRNEVAQA